MQLTNTRHWDALGKTDPKHTKGFSRAGGFKGTALKPIWIIQQLTKHFGPVGVGFGMNEPRFQIVDLSKDTGRVMVYCWVECWHTTPTNTFWGVGGDTVQDQFRDGRMAPDDEAFKKAYTDAVNNAFKFVGVGADIHMGQFEDSKYVREVEAEFAAAAPPPPAVAKMREFAEKIALATTLDDLDTLLATYGNALKEASKLEPAEGKRIHQAYLAKKQALESAVPAE